MQEQLSRITSGTVIESKNLLRIKLFLQIFTSVVSIHIQILCFASLRERFGQGIIELELINGTSVGSLWRLLFGPEKYLADRMLCTVNQKFSDQEVMLWDGNEEAFFPSVTGG